MAYFWSIPPIIIPASEETLSLLGMRSGPWNEVLMSGVWIVLSGALLLKGSKLTAQVTKIFMAMEIVAVLGFSILGMMHWHHIVGNNIAPSWQSFVIAMVVGATIVDGWEIDSYAAEEANLPRSTPGLGGIIGALMVLVYYGAIFPLMMHSVPLERLTHSSDVLSTWASTLVPHGQWIALWPILASTAGSLWLTTFILSKALYAMARDHILPAALAKRNPHQVATWTVVLPLIVGWLIITMQVFWQSLNTVFDLVLSAAGFFLILEFLFDSVSAAVFLTRVHHQHAHGEAHQHRGLLVVSYITALWFAATVVIFLVYGPKAIGGPIDWVIGLMVLVGIVFLVWGYKRPSKRYHVFDPETRLVIEHEPKG